VQVLQRRQGRRVAAIVEQQAAHHRRMLALERAEQGIAGPLGEARLHQGGIEGGGRGPLQRCGRAVHRHQRGGTDTAGSEARGQGGVDTDEEQAQGDAGFQRLGGAHARHRGNVGEL
jgi:hypothetical protein